MKESLLYPFPEREIFVRTYRYNSKKAGGKYTAILVGWHSCPRDGDIKDMMGNFETYDLGFSLRFPKYHYLDQEGRIYSTFNRDLLPPGVQEIVFENDHVWPCVYSLPWQASRTYRRRLEAGRDICAPCPVPVTDEYIAPSILRELGS